MIFGQYTIAELIDLISAKTAEIKVITQSYANLSPDWVSRDSAGFIDFTTDWSALQDRWQKALNTANDSITYSKLNPLPASSIVADSEYHGILMALQPGGEGSVTKGDLGDISQRILAQGGNVATSVTQPTATDIDNAVFKASDAAAKSMPSPIKTFVATVAPSLVPKNADQPNYKAIPKWKLYAGAGAAALAALFVLKRR